MDTIPSIWCSSTHLIWHILPKFVSGVLGPLISSLSFSPFGLLPCLLWCVFIFYGRGLLLWRCLASDWSLSSSIRWWFGVGNWRIGVFRVGIPGILDFRHALVSSFFILLFKLDGVMPREVLEVLGVYIGVATPILLVRL